jgi:hypothetical protein
MSLVLQYASSSVVAPGDYSVFKFAPVRLVKESEDGSDEGKLDYVYWCLHRNFSMLNPRHSSVGVQSGGTHRLIACAWNLRLGAMFAVGWKRDGSA